jgi:hypothetical protein
VAIGENVNVELLQSLSLTPVVAISDLESATLADAEKIINNFVCTTCSTHFSDIL